MAAAFLSSDGEYSQCARNLDELIFWLRHFQFITHGKIIVAIERVNLDPKWGTSSSGKFAEAVGEAKGILRVFKVSCERVSQPTWRKVIDVPYPKKASKKAKKQVFIDFARRRWPDAPLKSGNWQKDSNLADALCIAEYVRRERRE